VKLTTGRANLLWVALTPPNTLGLSLISPRAPNILTASAYFLFLEKATLITLTDSYWGVAVASVAYGSTTLGGYVNAVVDTGTTLIYIPTPAYNRFISASNGKRDKSTGLTRFSAKPTGTFTIKIGSISYPLTPEQYLVPALQ